MKKKLFLMAVLIMAAMMSFAAACGGNDDSVKAPGAVTNFAATSNDSGHVTLTWTAPSDIGGAAITKYQITKDNWATKIEKAADAVTHTFTDLTSGVAVTFKIRAVNSKGNGTESSQTITPVASPFTFTLLEGGEAYSVAASASTSGAIVIPETHNGKPVTTIAEDGFRSTSLLTSITIPASITKISQNAFRDCSNLTSVTLNASIDHIYQYSFQNCSKLTSIIIPEGVDSIGTSAFSGCTLLETVTLPSTLESIGNSVFNYCRALNNVILPEGLTFIGSNAFYVCDSLTSIIIPEGIEIIKAATFSGCDSLMEIVIPSSVETIEASAFLNVPNSAKIYSGRTSPLWWNLINISSNNGPVKNADSSNVYMFSETSKAGNYWHMVEGVPTIWDQD